MLSFILLLGAAQGAMGWYMVASGLVDQPAVSHYRLAAHLGLAFLIFALLVRTGLKIGVRPAEGATSFAPLRTNLHVTLGLFILTFLWGAFTAGLDAGLIYDSFPLMGKYPWPSEMFDMLPLYMNPFENHAAVQFIHRALATLTALSVLVMWRKAKFFHGAKPVSRIINLTLLAVIAQYTLGIATVISGVYLHIAVTHQAGALILLTCLMVLMHHIPPKRYSYDRS